MKRVAIYLGSFAILFFCLVLELAAAQSQQSNTAPAPTSVPFAGATISEWKGHIRVDLPGQPSAAPTRGEILPPGTILETGAGRLLLQLADGSQVLIRDHTRLTVQQPTPADRGYFQLLLGRLRALINKRTGGAPPFELGTPSAVIAVRGTQFEVEVNSQQETLVDVMEGQVEVIARHSGASVLVGPGFSTRVGMATPPETPRPTADVHPNMGNSADNQAATKANQGSGAAGRPTPAPPRGKP